MINAIQRVENLNHMLQIYSDRRKLPKTSPSLSQTQSEQLIYYMAKLTGYSEFENEIWQKYLSPNDFFLEMVREGDDDKLFIIHKVFSGFVPGFSLPIFNQIILSQTRKEARKIFVRLIQLLSNALGVPTTKAIRNAANQLLEIFTHYTILDAILFFEFCKKIEFKTEYQGVTNKGVSVEFLLLWAKEFLGILKNNRIEHLHEWSKNNSMWIQVLPNGMASKIDEFILSPYKAKKGKGHLNNLKYEQLKMAHEHGISKKCLKKRFHEVTIHYHLKYKVENLKKSEDEISVIAKERCKVYYRGLCERVELSESNRSAEEIEDNLKSKIKQIESSFRKMKYNDLLMRYFIHLQSLELLASESFFTDYLYCLIPKWRIEYKTYFDEEINRDTYPFDEEEFLKIKVLYWAKARLKPITK